MTPISPMTPVSQNHEGNTQENTGDIISTGVIMSPVNEMSPVENSENHAQKVDVGGIEILEAFFQYPRKKLEREGQDHQGQKSRTEATATKSVYTILQQEQPSNHHNLLYSCYYCDNFETNLESEYKRHVILKHPGGSYAILLKQMDLMEIQPKGKNWEYKSHFKYSGNTTSTLLTEPPLYISKDKSYVIDVGDY